MQNNIVSKPCHQSARGFTLIEIAIVLVVIGLLVGGILAGQSLIEGSRMRSVIADSQQLISATTDFHNKYKAMPGDMADAETLWGSDTTGGGTCPNISYNIYPKKETCNGTGDGKIDPSGAAPYERFRAIQHLANAELIPGAYSGVTGSVGASQSIVGINVPASQIPNGGFTMHWTGRYSTGDTSWFASEDYLHIIRFGAQTTTASDSTKYPLISGADAYSIDKKIDDGLPAYGRVMTWKPGASWMPSCATTSTESTAAYAIANTGQVCALIFKMGL